ncbi:Aste57867_11828 [Aphanomyces stellatus]|uniref:Aste57867_11828 protein n=1 Tax=Aphanomyces stellatus TaxID=120398 RepID=A0A485KU24_9STRA|nr:hypothetical protein As57867_011783 [Aphanomyces stellatus]VFT88683.1 Aste57867_11828 [Aphanomyces stellatus]
MSSTAPSDAPSAPAVVDVSAMKNKKWMYVDTAGGQKGPMDESVLKRLLRRGLIHGETYVWSPELPLAEWKMAKDVPLFTPVCVLWQKIPQWYYYDLEKVQQGPITTTELVAKFEDGDIDGLTLVWSSCQVVPSWTAMGEVTALKAELQEINDEREKEEALLTTQKAIDPKVQTFTEDLSGAARAIVAEDGKEFIYDAETRKWVTPEDKIRDELDDLAEAREVFDDEAPVVKKTVTAKNVTDPSPTTATTTSPSPAAAAADVGSTDAAPDVNPKKRKKSKKKSKSRWTASKTKTWVYINGLPLDITVDEVSEHFTKCGVIQKDLHTDEPKIKLYRNKDTGHLNGDGAVCYMKEPSVELALQLLDKSDIRPGCTIDVSLAVFSQKGETFVERKRVKLDNRAKVKKFEQEKALSWGTTGDEEFRIVVLKHMFKMEDFAVEAEGEELKEEIKQECETLGEIQKITFFEKHPLGVVIVKYVDAEGAEACIEKMNGRWFAGQQIECAYWDGTNYVIRESEVEEAERTEAFGQWLEEGSSDDEGESDDDDDAPPPQAHVGRVLPPLDDEDEDAPREQVQHPGRVLPPMSDDEDD